ncbi:MAG TPA: TolC family protein [Edaphocola sp.]|nr:TolC family protein [Edaphocola sp.]
MKKYWISVLFFISPMLKSFGQIQLSEDVRFAIAQALDHNMNIKNNKLSTEQAKLAEKSVWNKYIPTVSAMGLYGYANNDITIDFPTQTLPYINKELFTDKQTFDNEANLVHAGLTAKTILFSGGQIYNGAKAMGYKNQGDSLLKENTKDEVIMSIINGFDQLALLRQADTLLEQSARRLEKESLRVNKAIALGMAIPYDRDKITLAQLELNSQKEDIRSKQALLLLKLAQETGLSVDTLSKMQHQVNPIYLLEDVALKDKNELKALEAYKKAAEYNIKKEKGSLLPNVAALASYSYSSLYNANATTHLKHLDKDVNLGINELTIAPNFMVGVVMKWDLISGFERSHNIRSAKLAAEQIDNKYRDAQELLHLQLEKNKIMYQHNTNQIAIAQQRATIAEHNLQAAEKQYAAGLIGITERLEAENDVYKQRLNEMESIITQRQAALSTYQSAESLQQIIQIQ